MLWCVVSATHPALIEAPASKLHNARQLLARRTEQHDRIGRVLKPAELLLLYRQRHGIKPSRAESVLILASMLYEERAGLRSRTKELGWFWFRELTRRQLSRLLKYLPKSKTGQSDGLRSVYSPVSGQRRTLPIFNGWINIPMLRWQSRRLSSSRASRIAASSISR